jgi:hypothetical protein
MLGDGNTTMNKMELLLLKLYTLHRKLDSRRNDYNKVWLAHERSMQKALWGHLERTQVQT